MIEQQLIELVREYEVLAVVLGALIEEILVPIPSPIIPMAAGSILIETPYILPAAIKALVIIAFPASVASVVSSYFVYSIAYFGGEPAVKRFGKYLDLEWKEVQQMEEYFGRENEKYFVAGLRSIPIVPLSLVSGAAGLFRMKWKQYGIWSFIGMMPRNFFLAMLGWALKDRIIQVASRISTLSEIVAVTLAFTVAGYLLYRKANKMYRRMLFD